jgi:transposase
MNNASFNSFVGIDISKDKFDAYCIDMKGEKQFYLSCSMDRTGFEKLVSCLESLSMPKESLLIGMESTACYHNEPVFFPSCKWICGNHNQSITHF